MKAPKIQTFDDYYTTADTLFAPIYPFLLQDVESAYGQSLSGKNILEIGGGPGHMATQFLARAPQLLVEVDLSRNLLLKAQTRLTGSPISENRCLLIEAQAETLPLCDCCIDVVFSRGSVMFWQDQRQAFQEIRRVLRKDGMAWIGGGYGISTPADIRRTIIETRQRRETRTGEKTAIPRTHPETLLNFALELGGKGICNVNPPEFWLQWFPHRRD